MWKYLVWSFRFFPQGTSILIILIFVCVTHHYTTLYSGMYYLILTTNRTGQCKWVWKAIPSYISLFKLSQNCTKECYSRLVFLKFTGKRTENISAQQHNLFLKINFLYTRALLCQRPFFPLSWFGCQIFICFQ